MVGHRAGLGLVVGDQHRGLAGGAEDVADLGDEPLARGAVEVGERLVEQEQRGRGRERTGQGDALLLAARELVRMALAGIRQADQRQHLRDAPMLLGVGQAAQPEGHVARRVQVRKQRVLLEHHADPAPLGRQVDLGRGQGDAAQPDAAGAHRLEPRDRTQHRGLARAILAGRHDR